MPDPTQTLIDLALSEDIGSGDVTSKYFVDAERQTQGMVTVRSTGVISGVELAARVFKQVDNNLEVECLIQDGSKVSEGAILIRVKGSARSILTAERTALNFLQHLSGIASLTARYVEEVADTSVRILDTRKTTPGYRQLEKQAVLDGGGTNHRMGLHDRAMVKDNHLVAEGGLEALQQAIHQLNRDHPQVEVELECDSLDQVREFLQLDGVDYLLLDNMSPEEMRDAVELRGQQPKPLLEASGGIQLGRLKEVAASGVDFISVGSLTHSAPALDIGLDFISA
ncbi:MAG: carboxylating nicotinate-nucleotide diphosphorylase [Akkermansiaceae bacterium]|nr:carboxylating nicotinate-nucleotide diphosphorylase [Akkermansiaceae bacterium]